MLYISNYFYLSESNYILADSKFNNELSKKLWHSFSCDFSELNIENGENNIIQVAGTEIPKLTENKEFAINVTEKGFAICGRDYSALMRGYFVLLMKIVCESKDVYKIACGLYESNYILQNRMIHICVFPENDLYFMKKLIRLAGICQYTHIIIEFWGMLRYDCLKELAWPDAFTKEQAKELIDECRELGMEPIPMFNQLGHATACRIKYGKHVALDQNPRLQHLFTPDGWAWNIHSPEVRILLKQIRSELYDLFGEGEYMHIGCDEAYYYTRCDEERKKLPAFLKSLTDEIVEEGRRPMVWMDMMLEKDKYNKKVKAIGTCPTDEVEQMQESLNPATVMVDWQYYMTETPIETLISLKNNIRDAMGAPWHEPANYAAYVNTIAEYKMFGIMMTTWHTLQKNMKSILGCAKKCGANSFIWSEFSGLSEETATLLRRVSFEGNSYSDCGWSKKQIEV